MTIQEARKERRTDTYLALCYRAGDIQNVEKQLCEAGVRWYGVVSIPFRNMWGEQVGHQYAFLYQHDKEISLEVQT